MLIPITFNPNSSLSSTSEETPKLPAALAKVANDEVVLIELQGALEVEVTQATDKNGKFVGKLTINEDGSVSIQQHQMHMSMDSDDLRVICVVSLTSGPHLPFMTE
jgi:hypothetical protein